MNTFTDQQLLGEYAKDRSEAAFGELVRRHINLAYTVALRIVNDPHRAQDVTQAVFVALAQDATRLASHPLLSGWLHRTARNIAVQTARSEIRRRAREQEVASMNELLSANPEPAWDQLAPHLDDALETLNDSDRGAVLLRYFEKKSAQEMAGILGVSPEAAQKRVSRAVEQLRALFFKRGVAVGRGALGSMLAANTVQAAPAGLSLAITTAATAAGAATAAATAATGTKAILMTALQKTILGTALIATVGTTVYQTHQVSQLRDQVQVLRQHQTVPARGERLASDVADSDASATAPEPPPTLPSSRSAAPALSRAQMEAKLADLAKGIGRFGRRNLNDLIAGASLEDIPGLLAVVDQKLPDDLRRRFHDAWIDRWAAANPAGAFAYARTLQDGQERTSALASVFGNWVDKDVPGAVAAVEAMPPSVRDIATDALVREWMLTDPTAALNWGTSVDPKFSYLATTLAETRPDDAWKWANSVTDEVERGYLLKLMAGKVARSNPQEAADFAASLPPGENQNLIASDVAANWAAKDPHAAIQWAMTFPDGGARSETLGQIAKTWASKDPAAASTWIQSLPEGPDRNLAGMRFLSQVDNTAPQEAAAIVSKMSPSSFMGSTLVTGDGGPKLAPPTFEADWLRRLGIGEEQIEQMRKSAEAAK